MNIVQGIPDDFKKARLENWNSLSRFWMNYTQDDSFHRKVHSKVIDAVLRYAADIDAKSLIDLGCGPGVLLQELGNLYEWDDMVGVDFCPTMIMLAKRINYIGRPIPTFCVADIENALSRVLPPETHNFDFATSVFLVDEMGTLDAYFRSVASVLRQQGIFICATLDYHREIERYGEQIRAGGADDKSDAIVIGKGLPIHGQVTKAKLFRVLRHPDALKQAAIAHGLTLQDETVFDAEALKSRIAGPSLRLLVWRKGGET